MESLDAALDGAQAVVVLTDHSEFRQLRPEALDHFVGRVVVDARNTLGAEAWRQAGLAVWKTGGRF